MLDHFIYRLHLAIGLGVMKCGEVLLDTKLITEISNFLVVKQSPIIRYDRMGILNWHIMFFYKDLKVFASMILASGSTLTHFMK